MSSSIGSNNAALFHAPLAESVKKTGKVLLVCDAAERGSVMQTVAASLVRLSFDDLDGPPVVVGARNWITPAAELETLFFPQPAWLLDAIHERILPVPGHQTKHQPDACGNVAQSAGGPVNRVSDPIHFLR